MYAPKLTAEAADLRIKKGIVTFRFRGTRKLLPAAEETGNQSTVYGEMDVGQVRYEEGFE
ncbi:hypothetical protein J2T17_005728 [Paenibacillus mucilaginosus]|uniref:hypothetical protein n=1 Tax=Paenibacillus mucilaginosus TaxID=61624 RepID=UPI003D226DB1